MCQVRPSDVLNVKRSNLGDVRSVRHLTEKVMYHYDDDRKRSDWVHKAMVHRCSHGFFSVLLAILPILLHPYLPLVDLPNHIARHYIAATPGTALDAYYSYTFSMKGNSAGGCALVGGGAAYY